jgi:hypothetical protein
MGWVVSAQLISQGGGDQDGDKKGWRDCEFGLAKAFNKTIIHVRFYTGIALYSGVSVSHAPLRGIIGSTNCMVDRIEL